MPAASRPQLVVLSGPHKGDVIVLDDPLPVVFGRRAGVSLPDAALADVHCQVFQAGGLWYLQDFATPAGTWLGDERVEGARPLEPGRSFRIGETFVALLLPEQRAAAPPPPPPSPAVQEGLRAVDAAAQQARGWAPAGGPTPPPGARPGRLDEGGRRRRLLDAKTDILPIEAPSPADDSDAQPVRDLADTVELRTRLADADDEGLAPHTTLGEYDVLRELGSGSLGRVYKAYDRRRKRVVAVKVLSPELARDQQAVGRFLRGAQAGARLAHPNVCAIYGAGHTAGKIYVSMEYVEGLDLGAHVAAAGGHLQPRQAVAILARVTDALVYAHARDVLHRNVSPRNVLVGDAGRTVKLVDLALAKRATADKGLAITQSGQVLSQSPFAAPELLFDVQRVDHRADVYGVGATLFFALTGHPPYEGNLIDVAQRMQKGKHGDLRRLARGASKPLLELVERCLRPDPAARYPAARDLREAFADLPEGALE